MNEKNFTLPIIPDWAAKIIPLALERGGSVQFKGMQW
jgi:hypothetical protein